MLGKHCANRSISLARMYPYIPRVDMCPLGQSRLFHPNDSMTLEHCRRFLAKRKVRMAVYAGLVFRLWGVHASFLVTLLLATCGMTVSGSLLGERRRCL